MKTRSVARLLNFLFLLILVLLLAYDLWRLADIDSLKNYYLLPTTFTLDYRTIPLWATTYTLFYDVSLFTVVWPVTFIALCLFPVLLPLGRIFSILSRNFESFEDARRALGAFIRECSKKNKMILSVPLAYFSFGPSIALPVLLISLPYGSHTFILLYIVVNSLGYSLPPLQYFALVTPLSAQVELICTIAVALFVLLVAVLIVAVFYESSFQNELGSLSPENFKP
ncbi:MAG: hypothetical protein ACTSP1_08380 [Candidatus Freyarchaeota archaeon]